MSDNDKHRARIFLHRGDLVQARAAWEAAVADDRIEIEDSAPEGEQRDDQNRNAAGGGDRRGSRRAGALFARRYRLLLGAGLGVDAHPTEL